MKFLGQWWYRDCTRNMFFIDVLIIINNKIDPHAFT